jgi:4-amino-4-deoxy-L-arabinose transferase-like glycosyltransferase
MRIHSIPSRLHTNYLLIAILLLGFAVRLAAALILPDQTSTLSDSIVYRELGRNFWTTFQIGRPYYMPLYPALLGLTGPGWGELLLNIGLSTATVWLIFLLAEQIFSDAVVALLAAAGAALYPNFIFFSVVGLTEPLFVALVVAAFVCWYRGSFVGAACLATLAILTRPIFDLIAPVLVVYFALVVHRMSITGTIRQFFVYVAVYCILMTPWWLHNYHAYGSFVRLNLGGGLALYSGNNAANETGGIDADLAGHSSSFMAIADPVARDRALRDAAIGFINDHPKQFLSQAVAKFFRFWRLWPKTESYAGSFF